MAAALDPATLSMRLILEKPVEQPDGQGGFTISFQSIGVLHARLEPVSVAQEETGAATRTIASFRAILRHRTDIAAGMRLTRQGRIFMVRAVIPANAQSRYLIATLEEETP